MRPPHVSTTVAWFNCSAGVAGDMVLAALVDAGADRVAIDAAIATLGVDGGAVSFQRVERCGISAMWADVDVASRSAGGDHPHRPAREIIAMLERSGLPARVTQRATDVFRRLAEVEGAIHGVSPDDVELHEVGAIDSIIDVVGVCAGLESLGVDELYHGPIALGSGSVSGSHGVVPNPAPATVALLAMANAPASGLETTLEVTTPTGAALMTVLGRSGAMPTADIVAVGRGAGTADPPERANVVQVVIGSSTGSPRADEAEIEPLVVVETNVDDVSGEVLSHTIATLLARGASDAWVTPIVMKKGRPAHTVSVLCDPSRVDALRAVLLAETGSLGARAVAVERWAEHRSMRVVEVDGQRVAVKIAGRRRKPEPDDVARVAARLGLTLREVHDRAQAAADAAGRTGDPPETPDP
jgi:uncharacterized protein (TIGR00299 family) protein